MRTERGYEKMASDYSDMVAQLLKNQVQGGLSEFSTAQWKEYIELVIEANDIASFWLTNEIPTHSIFVRLPKDLQIILQCTPQDREHFKEAIKLIHEEWSQP